jgi:integrase
MLGKYGSAESYELYEQYIGMWRQGVQPPTPTEVRQAPQNGGTCGVAGEMGVSELIALYTAHADQYYRKNGERTSEYHCIKAALQVVLDLYGNLPVSHFTPAKLTDVQKAMMNKKTEGSARPAWTRETINKHVHRVKRMFRWGVVKEFVNVTVADALGMVPQIPAGRYADVREGSPVEPVPDWMIDAIEKHVPRQVWAMIELQRFTGMRPGEVVIVRAGDFELVKKDAWVYRPHRHKKQHFGQARPVVIGPRGIKVLQEYLKGKKAGDYLFSPTAAERERYEKLRQRFDQYVWYFPSEREREIERRAGGKILNGTAEWRPGDHYTEASYRRCIQRACRKAIAAAKRKSKTDRVALLQVWTPNQIRHAVGTRIRDQFGLDGAQVVLGHEHADTSEIYSKVDLEKAIQIMRKVG